MLGKTHAAVGAATCTLVMQPYTMPQLMVCVTLGALGGIIPDVDIRNSDAEKHTKDLFSIFGISLITGLIYSFFRPDAVKDLVQGLDVIKLFGIVGILVLLMIGLLCNHRHFTHSIEYTVLMGVALFLATRNLLLCEGIMLGMISHDLVDTLNFKKVHLSTLFKIEKCFNVCKADSKLATAIGLCSGFSIILYAVIRGIAFGMLQ